MITNTFSTSHITSMLPSVPSSPGVAGRPRPVVPASAGAVRLRPPPQVDGLHLRLQGAATALRRLHGLGDEAREDTGAERLEVHRHEHL